MMTAQPIYKSFNLSGRNHNEFAEDVLNILKRRKVTFYGCPADYVEFKLNGKISIEFVGYRNNKPWKGTLQFDCMFPQDKIMLADPVVVAEACAQSLELTKAY